jgi:hypothetical protein
MNSALARQASEAFAARVNRTAGQNASADRLIEEAYAMALGRAPLAEEIEMALGFLKSQAGLLGKAKSPAQAEPEAFAQFCQVLLETNEFVYRP